jgi:hypothetical protein
VLCLRLSPSLLGSSPFSFSRRFVILRRLIFNEVDDGAPDRPTPRRNPFGSSFAERKSELDRRKILSSALKSYPRDLHRYGASSREMSSSPPRTTRSSRLSTCLTVPCSPYSTPRPSHSAVSDSILQRLGLSCPPLVFFMGFLSCSSFHG